MKKGEIAVPHSQYFSFFWFYYVYTINLQEWKLWTHTDLRLCYSYFYRNEKKNSPNSALNRTTKTMVARFATIMTKKEKWNAELEDTSRSVLI